MKGKRILSAVLSAALALQLSPLAAFAEDTPLLPDPAPAALTEPAPEEPTPEPETTPVLLAEPTPEPVPESAGDETALLAEPTPETEATPTPEPTAEPTATPAEETPAPEATAEPTPEPSAEPTPEPSAEPTVEPSPDPAEQVQALIDALPDADAVTEDTADEVEAQLTAIDDAKATLTDEQLAGLDFARYDAAANALLALWGEAPTDEVETLETTYTAPAQDSEGYYQIATVDNLYWLVTSASKDVKAKLMNDIKVNDSVLNADGSLNTVNSTSFKAWTPITDFAGTLDGNGHTISGLYCNTPDKDYVGLFGNIAQGGTVTHLGVIDSYFAGSNYVGGVCGYNKGIIRGCYSTATVNSNVSSASVLVGYSMGTVENSFAYGNAQGGAGTFGLSQGTMKNCFYLATTTDGTSVNGKTAATADQFKSGEVAYLLGLQDSFWKQDLSKHDAYPSFNGQSVGKANGSYHNHDNAGSCDTCKNSDKKPGQATDGKYIITTEAELKWLADFVNNNSSNFVSAILATDIAVTNWNPIGTQDHHFVGTLDGNGHTVTIKSMANSSADNAGLVGYLGANGKITNIKVAGTVTGGSNVGGVVGYCLGTLQNVINAADVNGASNVGGVIGYYVATSNACYNLGNTGAVTASDNKPGGVMGTNNSGLFLYNSYSITQPLCGTPTSGGYQNCFDKFGALGGVTKADVSAFTSGEVAYLLHSDSKGQTWGQNIGTDNAPNCLGGMQVFRGAFGEYHNHTGDSCNLCAVTPPQNNSVYQISTAQQLVGYAELVQSSSGFTAKAVLTQDITVTGNWTPIYCSSFNGTFDGQGHSITFQTPVNSTSSYAGLFARISSNAIIENLTVSGNFSTTGDYVGAIVGLNYGTIKNCRVIESTISGNGGALAGVNHGTIQNSYSLVENYPLAGGTAGTITNSYRLGGENTDQTTATLAQFKSGEIAMKLAGNAEADPFSWGQTIGTDDYPVLGGKTVYCFEGHYHNHTGGSCAACDDKPDKNTDGAYVIISYENLLWFAKLVNGTLLNGMDGKLNANAVLNTDISVDDNWTGIGTDTNAYGGTFSGNGHTVTLKSAKENAKQLFGTTSTDAELNSICVKDGCLTHTDSATVTSCYRPEKEPLFNNKAAGSAANCYTLGKLTEQADSGAAFTNCFAGIATGNGAIVGIEVKNPAAFTSGEVAYNLTKGDTRWGQKLTDPNKNEYPIYPGEPVYYSETATNKYHNHTGNICPDCDAEPIQDAEGVYIIRTVANLKWFANWVNGVSPVTNQKHLSASAKLGANITLNANVLNTNGELNTGNASSFENWTPIGGEFPFQGTFDGQGYTISGLYASIDETYNGLFGNSYTATIKNITIVDSYFRTTQQSIECYIGGVCGFNCYSSIQNCKVNGIVCGSGAATDNEYVGGICGNNIGTISGCTSNVVVTGNGSYTGGICGRNAGIIEKCHNTGVVMGTNYVGGICGVNAQSVQDSDNTGKVEGKESYIGGVCGTNESNSSKVINCHNVAEVTAQNVLVGGVCGENNGTVQNSYNIGKVTAAGQLGGVCGQNYEGIVLDCYNQGNVAYTATTESSNENIGGVCGENINGTVQGSYNTGNVTGLDYAGGVCGYNRGYSSIANVQNCYNSGKMNGNSYVGGVCGYNANGTVQGSYNTGTVTGTADRVGGICGESYSSGGDKTVIKESYNTGAVTGNSIVGGVCGQNRGGAIWDCYNMGAVASTSTYEDWDQIISVGGVCGIFSGSNVARCYNMGNITGASNHCHKGGVFGVADEIAAATYYLEGTCDGYAGYLLNTDVSKPAPEPMKSVSFSSGEVAYLLQKAVENAAAEGETPAETWGQTIGTANPVLVWQTDDYKKVYQTSPCPGYSNTKDERKAHQYENGECIYCGEKQPTQVAYTVTIPATVELGDTETTATISATGVVLPEGKQLNVKIVGSSDNEFAVTLEGDTSENPDSATYSVKDAKNELVNSGDTVLNVTEDTESVSTKLTFNAPTRTTYSGTYKGTVTFTVSVDDKAS